MSSANLQSLSTSLTLPTFSGEVKPPSHGTPTARESSPPPHKATAPLSSATVVADTIPAPQSRRPSRSVEEGSARGGSANTEERETSSDENTTSPPPPAASQTSNSPSGLQHAYPSTVKPTGAALIDSSYGQQQSSGNADLESGGAKEQNSSSWSRVIRAFDKVRPFRRVFAHEGAGSTNEEREMSSRGNTSLSPPAPLGTSGSLHRSNGHTQTSAVEAPGTNPMESPSAQPTGSGTVGLRTDLEKRQTSFPHPPAQSEADTNGNVANPSSLPGTAATRPANTPSPTLNAPGLSNSDPRTSTRRGGSADNVVARSPSIASSSNPGPSSSPHT